MSILEWLPAVIALGGLTVAAAYAVLAMIAAIVWRLPRRPVTLAAPPPVTMLKPLCGAEPGLYANLRSFCLQAYPDFQIVFGIADPHDPACDVARRLRAEFPALAIDVIVDPRVHGSNGKVSNLINMLPAARHDLLVMSDSDCTVGPDYLDRVTVPLQSASVGLVTCLYRGMPARSVWSRIGAMYINEWYVPQVLLAWLFGHQGYVSGQTIALRRSTLTRIGGFEALADHLAEDHRMGSLVRNLGLRIVLSPYLVLGDFHEDDLQAVTSHELRWMRTLRTLAPRSMRWIFVTFSLPMALVSLGVAASRPPISTAAWVLFTLAVAARLAVHLVHRWHRDRSLLKDLWLVPARDLLLCWVWWRSMFSSNVRWRGGEFVVNADGTMRRIP
jgi:ceramide glucosyltransferase